jgi:hypothetical protein
MSRPPQTIIVGPAGARPTGTAAEGAGLPPPGPFQPSE